jgi:threonine/homoserine/homoserine lactone efflux protein
VSDAALPWAEMATAWLVFGANVLSPGPNVFTTVAIALGSGRRVALAVLPAIAIGVAFWAALALAGAGALFRAAPWAAPALTAVGGALLLWFAARYAVRALAWEAGEARGRALTAGEAFWTTLGVLATNPKALTTWLVLVSIFPAGEAGPLGFAVMVAGAVAVACAGHLVYALAFSTRPAAAAFLRAGRWVTAGVAVFFAGLGASLLWRAGAALLA